MAEIITVEQAAAELGLSVSMVQHLINTKQLKASKLNPNKQTSAYVIDAQSLAALKKQRGTAPLKQSGK